MKDYGPAKGGKKKDPNAPQRPPSGFFLFCQNSALRSKNTNLGISTGDVAKKLGEKWSNLNDSEKQPYNNKAAKLKEKYEKDVATKYKGKSDGAKGTPSKVAWKKVEEENKEDGRGGRREEEEGGGRGGDFHSPMHACLWLLLSIQSAHSRGKH